MRSSALIVDDDPATIEVLPDILRLHLPHLGVETSAWRDDIRHRIYVKPYSVVLADVRMSNVDGFSWLRRIRDLQPQTIVVVMSVTANVPFASRVFDAGAFDVLPKPFRREHLIASLCQGLRAHTLARDIRAVEERLVRVQRRLDEGKAKVGTLRRQTARLVNPVVVEAVILHSRAMAANEHAKMLLDEMHKWRQLLRGALRMVKENARYVALTRARAGGYGDLLPYSGR